MPYGGTRPYRLHTKGYKVRCFKTPDAMFRAFYALQPLQTRKNTELYRQEGRVRRPIKKMGK